MAMADPTLRRFVEDFLHVEAKPTLPAAVGLDLDEYIASLIHRFSNPGVGDQIARLCLDGSSKFPKFLIPTIRAQLAEEGHVEHAALALAGWCEYLRVGPAGGDGERAADPRMAVASDHALRSFEDPATFLRFADVFGDDLPGSELFTEAFVSALSTLRTSGVQSALAALQ